LHHFGQLKDQTSTTLWFFYCLPYVISKFSQKVTNTLLFSSCMITGRQRLKAEEIDGWEA
jgi:hypothetical protein